jgi:hypothetical protein
VRFRMPDASAKRQHSGRSAAGIEGPPAQMLDRCRIQNEKERMASMTFADLRSGDCIFVDAMVRLRNSGIRPDIVDYRRAAASRFVCVGDIGSREASTRREERAEVFITRSQLLCVQLRLSSG